VSAVEGYFTVSSSAQNDFACALCTLTILSFAKLSGGAAPSEFDCCFAANYLMSDRPPPFALRLRFGRHWALIEDPRCGGF